MFYVNYLQHMYCCGLQLVNISVKFSIWYQLEMFDVSDLMLSCQYHCDNVWKDTHSLPQALLFFDTVCYEMSFLRVFFFFFMLVSVL